ncbi:hypothetical protein [Lacimicrobium sp. SS2-24]|nr:hypothetical protein [Lacimicrobium sp. SS2-24]
MLDQLNLISLLLLPVVAYLAGAVIITLIEKVITRTPACNNGFRPVK